MPTTPTETTLRDAARAVRRACPTCRALPAGALACEACVRAVCRLLAERMAAEKRETSGRDRA